MSNEQEVPFWRRPLPPVPGPQSRPLAVADDVVLLVEEPVTATVVEPEPTAPEPVINPYDALKAAEHTLDLARAEARERRAATGAARAAFAKALADWSRGEPIQTQEQQARAFIATSNADRAARAAAGRLPYRPNVTATARAMSGGNQRRGGGSAYRRGPGGTTAFTKAEAMTMEANRLRAAAAAVKPRGQ
jgi:hypothetical protein